MMEYSTLESRGAGPGLYPDVTKIPTPPLQRAAIFIMFVLPTLAVIVFSMRIYTRITMRAVGVGKFSLQVHIREDCTDLTTPDDYLCGLALVRFYTDNSATSRL